MESLKVVDVLLKLFARHRLSARAQPPEFLDALDMSVLCAKVIKKDGASQRRVAMLLGRLVGWFPEVCICEQCRDVRGDAKNEWQAERMGRGAAQRRVALGRYKRARGVQKTAGFRAETAWLMP